MSDCAPFKCRSGSCRTSCTANSHCDTGAVCYGGVCKNGQRDGRTCSGTTDCASGNCTDGYCCESSCATDGYSCSRTDTGFSNGQCKPLLAGLNDPACSDQGASTCGKTGKADGSGGCQDYANGTVCAAARCSGTDTVGASTCQSGSCSAPAPGDCGLYGCSSGSCRSTCTGDSHCDTAAGSWCDTSVSGGMCSDVKDNGSTCSGANECASSFCVDGFCSSGACTAACYSTDGAVTGGANGSCLPVLSGHDPGGDCSDQGASGCGRDGTCDGSGSCRKYSSGTVCAATSCSSGDVANADTCDGSGTCLDGGITDCGNYTCSGASCRSSCSSNSHCVAGAYCGGSLCVAKKGNGSTCSGGSQCSSGNCVDGYCCNSSCSGTCKSCNSAYTASANGVCANVDSGRDPDNNCSAAGASTCDNDGSCNGSGGCRNYASGTVCTSASCSGDDVLNADTCNGSGTCNDGGTTDCGNYGCSGGSCRSSCSQDGHCASGSWCNGSTCTSEKTNGSTCTGNNECSSDYCVDGYCCNTACSGSCMSCDSAYTASSNGVCANVDNGRDPRGSCAAQGGCGQTGDCNGSGGCAVAPGTQLASAASCGSDDHNVVGAVYCNGSGGGVGACGNYKCQIVSGWGQCKTSCSRDSDCFDAFCFGSSCVTNRPPVANNSSHSVNEDCYTSNPNCVRLKDVKVDASDPDGDTITYEYIAGTAEDHGTLTGNVDGSNAGIWSYSPDTDYHGTVSFKYRATDGALWSSEATVTIRVINVNDSPWMSNIGNQTLALSQSTSGSGKSQTTSFNRKDYEISVDIGDVDHAINQLTLTCSSPSSTNSICKCKGTSKSSNGRGSIVTLTGNAVGTARITVRLSDGSASVSDTFTCRVTQ